jgi:hypothetical protein
MSATVTVPKLEWPVRIRKMSSRWCGKWIPVTQALPPERLNVIVIVRGDDTPAYAWLRYAAGDKDCPYFVCPQLGAMETRGCHIGRPEGVAGRKDITYWYCPFVEGLPWHPKDWETKEWGLGGYGFEYFPAEVNQ